VKDFYVLMNFWLIILVNSECPTLFSSAVYSIYFLLINFCLFPLLLLLFLEYDLKSVRVTSFSRSLSQIQFLKMTSLTYFSRNIEKRGGWVKKMRSLRPQCWERNRKKSGDRRNASRSLCTLLKMTLNVKYSIFYFEIIN